MNAVTSSLSLRIVGMARSASAARTALGPISTKVASPISLMLSLNRTVSRT